MKYRWFFLLLCVVALTACERSYKKHLLFSTKGLEPAKVEVNDYGHALFQLDTLQFKSELSKIQNDFIHFLDADLNDSSQLMKLYNFVTDPWLINLYHQSRDVFPTYVSLEKELTSGFRRLHHYYPNIQIPQIYSYVSGVQYETPVMTDGHALVIGIDCYLGSDAMPYQQLGIPRYLSERMRPEHIGRDVFASIYDYYFTDETASQTILEEMIRAGKKLFFLEAMQPNLADQYVIGYTNSQLDWVLAHESEIWKSFVGEQLLYSSDQLIFRKLFGDGPSSQEFSADAPPRLGEWVGWQIVRHFMDQHPDICIVKLHGINDAQDILTRSRYRPKK